MNTVDPAQPWAYPRRVLVALTGLTPQVMTETLYALLQQQPAFVPTELHLVTTDEGKRRAVQLLRDPVHGLTALWAQYGSGPMPAFDYDTHVHVIREAEQVLDDVTDAAHQVSTADTIIETLRPLALDPQCAVHASIAGGRKSMSFYMGYVMSLLAREQDRMSHVLVNAPFESLPAFSFPPRIPNDLGLPDGRLVSTAEARVKLSQVPFVHLYQRLPQQLLESLVSFQSLVEQAELALARPQLVIDMSRRSIGVRGPGSRSLVVSLSPHEMALYAYLADTRRHGVPPLDSEAEAGLVHFPAEKARTPGRLAIDERRLARIVEPLNLAIKDVLSDWTTASSRNERFNGIKSKLAHAMGERLFFVVRVWGPSERGRGKDGRYGLLGLEPAQIHFGNVTDA